MSSYNHTIKYEDTRPEAPSRTILHSIRCNIKMIVCNRKHEMKRKCKCINIFLVLSVIYNILFYHIYPPVSDSSVTGYFSVTKEIFSDHELQERKGEHFLFLHSSVITGVRSAVITEVSKTKRFETSSRGPSMKRDINTVISMLKLSLVLLSNQLNSTFSIIAIVH